LARTQASPVRQTGPAEGDRVWCGPLSYLQAPYGSMLHPPSTSGIDPVVLESGLQRPNGSIVHPPLFQFNVWPSRQRPNGSRLQPPLLQRLRRRFQSAFQGGADADSRVVVARGTSSVRGLAAKGPEATRTRQRARAAMQRRDGRDMKFSFPGGGSCVAVTVRRAPLSSE